MVRKFSLSATIRQPPLAPIFFSKNLGYNIPQQSEAEKVAFTLFLKKNKLAFLGKISPYIEAHDVFQNPPFFFMYFLPILREYYPDSKFIYTMHEPFAWYHTA
jgi:hypothetical protein